MSLREQAAADLVAFLEDDAAGFSISISVTDPDGTSAELKGFTNDIGQTIDPQTGMAVVGRQSTVVLPMASLTDAGLGVPVGIADGSSKPWLVTFADFAGADLTFKVSEAMPDATVGAVTCYLEAYRP